MITTLGIIAIAVLVTIGGYKLGTLVYQKDTKLENVKRSFIDLAVVLSGMGLKTTPELLKDLAVGDISSVADKVKKVVDLFVNSPDAVVGELDRVFENVLAAKLQTEAGRALIAAKLADYVEESDVSVVKDAPTAMVK